MKKYGLEIRWSEEDCCYLARCTELSFVNVRGWIAHGDTWEDAAREAQVAISNILNVMAAAGQEIPQPVPFDVFRNVE